MSDGRVFVGEYGPGPAGWPGQRSFGHRNRRDDRAYDRHADRFGASFQRLRLFDWAFVQSGGLVTADRNLEFGRV